MSEPEADAPETEPQLAVGEPAINPEKLELAERLVEAVLFAAAEPVTVEALAERLPDAVDPLIVLRRLEERYRNRGVRLMQIAGGWAFQTAPDLAPALTVTRAETRKLTRAQIETLAVIAYHQPLTRPEIEEIRGVSLSRGVLDTLLDLGWVRPGRRREAPGRPLTWVTTREFLMHFGLDGIADLPGVNELRALGLLDDRAGAIADMPQREEELDLPEPAAAIDPDIEAAESLGGVVSPDDEDGR